MAQDTARVEAPGAQAETARAWLGRVGVPAIVASALFWAWFDLAVYRPTLYLPFSADIGVYRTYFLVALGVAMAPLLFASLRPNRCEPLLTRRPTWVATTCVALVAAGAASASALAGSAALAAVAGALAGLCLGVFQLTWSKVYAVRGARTASTLLALSIGLGSLVDFSMFGLPVGVAAAATALLPVVSLALVMVSPAVWGRGGTGVPEVGEPAAAPTTSLDSLFEGSRLRVFGLSLSLVAAFFIYGISFAYDRYMNVFSSASLDTAASDALLIARGLTALAVFLAIYLLPRRMYSVFRAGILVGVAGCVAAPSIGVVTGGGTLLPGVFIAVGYTTIDIVTWTLLSEISERAGVGVSATLGPGRFMIHAGHMVGFALVAGLMAASPGSEHIEAFNSTVAMLMVVAEMLLLGENAGLWMLARVNVSPEAIDPATIAAAGTAAETAAGEARPGWPGIPAESAAAVLAARFGLTEREAEICDLLAAGRSRARIATSLGISENTVNSHILALYRKLGVHNRQELLDVLGG